MSDVVKTTYTPLLTEELISDDLKNLLIYYLEPNYVCILDCSTHSFMCAVGHCDPTTEGDVSL